MEPKPSLVNTKRMCAITVRSDRKRVSAIAALERPLSDQAEDLTLNAVILAIGVGLVILGHKLRSRRIARRAVVTMD